MSAGRLLRAVRRRCGFNQVRAGAIIGGVHWVTISRWENEKVDPPAWAKAVIEAWARAADEHPEYVNEDNLNTAWAKGPLYVLCVILEAAYYEPADEDG